MHHYKYGTNYEVIEIIRLTKFSNRSMLMLGAKYKYVNRSIYGNTRRITRRIHRSRQMARVLLRQKK